MAGIKGMKGSGGKRKGAGAPSRYGEPTVMLTFRVPISKVAHVKEVVKALLLSFHKTTL